MSLPFSKNQIDRLGERLSAAETPSSDDLTMLEEVIVCHAGAVSAATQRLEVLETGNAISSVSITGRAKTTQTIIEKVRRNKTRLSSMDDLAGVRLVANMTLNQQDKVATVVGKLFEDGRQPRMIDRRADPRAGYRAVHQIARIDGMNVEIQIRTTLQDMWANIFEKTADTLGRQIRYGLPPTLAPNEDPALRPKIVTSLISMSDAIYKLEVAMREDPTVDVTKVEPLLRDFLESVTSMTA